MRFVRARYTASLQAENPRPDGDGEAGAEKAAIGQFVAARQPTGRFIDPENVAEADPVSVWPRGGDITGAALPIDGGWMAG